MNILNIFKNKYTFDIKSFEEKCPIGSWYKSGNSQIVRLSNVYIKDNVPKISIEYPVTSGLGFKIVGEDDLSPSYLNGRIRMLGTEANKLENSYWKTIEKDLANRTKTSKNNYQKFLDFGKKS